MQYENFEIKDKNQIIKLLEESNVFEIPGILIGSVNGINDWQWLQNLFLSYVSHSDFWVSKTAISCLGDIARIHGRLDKQLVFKKLEKIEDAKLQGVIEETIEDILIFV